MALFIKGILNYLAHADNALFYRTCVKTGRSLTEEQRRLLPVNCPYKTSAKHHALEANSAQGCHYELIDYGMAGAIVLPRPAFDIGSA